MNIYPVGPDELARYAAVPIAFEVRSRLRVTPIQGGLGGLALVEEPVDQPYVKDYDLDESPEGWPACFDVSNWVFFLALEGRQPVGAAAVVFASPEIHMLEGRSDLTVLWDIRVHPEHRGKGIGSALFHLAEDWSRQRGPGVREMKIETQDININACRFYARQGCVLKTIHSRAYAKYPDEAMLLWYKAL